MTDEAEALGGPLTHEGDLDGCLVCAALHDEAVARASSMEEQTRGDVPDYHWEHPSAW